MISIGSTIGWLLLITRLAFLHDLEQSGERATEFAFVVDAFVMADAGFSLRTLGAVGAFGVRRNAAVDELAHVFPVPRHELQSNPSRRLSV